MIRNYSCSILDSVINKSFIAPAYSSQSEEFLSKFFRESLFITKKVLLNKLHHERRRSQSQCSWRLHNCRRAVLFREIIRHICKSWVLESWVFISFMLMFQVKEHIELCIQRCMSLEETEQHIQSNFGIESVVVRRLWRRLEDENQEFFRSYCIRRRLVSVVNRFNDQLERQQELMRETGMLERPNHDAAISGQDQEQEQVQLQLQPQPQPQLILQWLQTQEQVLNQQQQQILQRLQTQTQSHYHQQQTQVLHQPQMPSLGNLPRKEIL
ncbi:PREDICTED: putative uncharacterized protein DDB_G0271606 isoform X1 [Tarenaya hassleriana]|uniref:putative uncharacterized protein DDB_G0271606 isoform X1 n=1 Tax=Tarenaya hassleriana TaxID=28532 RepID=UPI0008FD15E2|nr:PREDICTED: putative uncharacterized protein DDB_G0271606 isoform X1 [Tarenaya hassleriana]